MYRPGHYGMALLCYAPVGLALVLVDRPTVAVVGGGVTLGLAPVPDLDQRIPLVTHRGVTHTVAFAVAVAVVLGALGWNAGDPTSTALAAEYAVVGALVGAVSIGSHLLADVITPAGLNPFWPLSARHYTLDITRADSLVANYLLLGLGVVATLCVLAVAAR